MKTLYRKLCCYFHGHYWWPGRSYQCDGAVVLFSTRFFFCARCMKRVKEGKTRFLVIQKEWHERSGIHGPD